MEIEFISLCKLGVGPILVRYGDIILLEPTPRCFTRIDLSYGDHIIVEEDIFCVMRKIYAAKILGEQNNDLKTETKSETKN
jgi:hypothetical protein